MEVLLGIDYGSKRIGLAKSDALGMFAHPIAYLENRGSDWVIPQIQKICEEERIETLVIGLPKEMSGQLGEASKKVLEFIESLKTKVSQKIVTWDERFTTKQAQVIMFQSGLSGQKKREKIDSLAAQILLQGYLDWLAANKCHEKGE